MGLANDILNQIKQSIFNEKGETAQKASNNTERVFVELLQKEQALSK